MTTTPTTPHGQVPEALRVPLDSLHADAGYLCGRLLNGSLTQEQVVESIRRRIDAAKLAAITAQAISAEPAEHVQKPAEIEHVTCDVSQNWAESNMSTQPATQQEAQEPVAWLSPWRADQVTTDYDAYGEHGIPLYTAPQPSPTPQADSQPAPVLDERDDFEKVFPLPSGCIRVGTGYASIGYSNWAAHTHCERWQGWQARAARAPADSVLEDAALLEEARDALWQPANVALCERIDAYLDAARKQGGKA